MTVVVTPARTLLSSDGQCPSANLECQVSGARVCIDSLSACDGVPNCGSYDIYDEDRLTCGRSAGLQHNVCLAAITFLAVLLTILYIVHYWLKRCVPRVSDAFFIYTDAAENVLYLDPIMRSPYDTEDPKEFYRTGVIHDDMECTDMKIKSKSVSPYIRRFLSLFRRRCNSNRDAAPVKKEQEIDIDFDRQRMYSYGEVELTKLGAPALTDMAVQTGSSLIGIHTLDSVVVNVSDHGRSLEVDSEMEEIVTYYEVKRRSTESNFIDLDDRVSTERVFKELSILEFFKRARSVSVDMPPYQEERSSEYLTQLSPQREEEEIQSLNYEPSFEVPASVTSMNTEISGKKIEHANVQKKLRFEDIKAEPENVNVEGAMPERGRRSVVYGTGKNLPIEQSDSGGQIDEPSTSTNRKTYFWGSSKNKPKKPTKKKTQLFSSTMK
ncbi:uncharacterized protein LOC111351065 [Spodoptera litura]|uniref:Uncharacterized protein LOC111351065 n=1 Tax=Spodoptera litura TaxID=69820 RepID=A0A9J7DWH8_SPOLT|nr:uncharacterized protein LOC111351065 [Spodoptera litura]